VDFVIPQPPFALGFERFSLYTSELMLGLTCSAELKKMSVLPFLGFELYGGFPKTTSIFFVRFNFRSGDVPERYYLWPELEDLSLVPPFNGPIERRGNSLVIFPNEQPLLASQLKAFLNADLANDEVTQIAPEFMKSAGEYNAPLTRKALAGKIAFSPSKLVPYPFKPFDIRLAYLDADIQPLFSRPNGNLIATAQLEGNEYLISRDSADKTPEGPPFYFSRSICDYDFISGHARHFPLLLNTNNDKAKKTLKDSKQISFDMGSKAEPLQKTTVNRSAQTSAYLKGLGLSDNAVQVKQLWRHVLAIGYSGRYLHENRAGIRDGWPRVPLPSNEKDFLQSSQLGNAIAGLLNLDIKVEQLKNPTFASLARISSFDGKPLDPNAHHLEVRAGWGYRDKEGNVMPGSGKAVVRSYTEEEQEQLAPLTDAYPDSAQLLGNETLDIPLNDVAYWSNVPSPVWEYVIGGYQVLKKWLSYREMEITGQSLDSASVDQFKDIVCRLTLLVLLQPQLDDNYSKIADNSFTFIT